jgi:prevent-host-death family protein
MTMKTISVSEAKATLSEQLRHVKRGEEVVLTERGKPVARLVPAGEQGASTGLEVLAAAGLVRCGTGVLPPGFWARARPADPEATLRRAVAAERGEGW